MDHPSETTLARWTVPQCPFLLEYSPSAMAVIRLAVVDAFHALARGGVEIGGLLLGAHRDNRVTITGSVPIECEHAFGPSFTLSAKDIAKLEILIGEKGADGPMVVGWYHSHTRSHIHLSESDISIYRRFFPKPWQIALVLRPHAFEPVRGGFFFREPDGSVHSSISYREFNLEIAPIGQAPLLAEAAAADTSSRRPPVFPAAPDATTREEEDDSTPTMSEAPSKQLEIAPPAFLAVPQTRHRRWPAAATVALSVAAAGAGGYMTRERWLPQLLSLAGRPIPASPVEPVGRSLGLTATDSEGHLHIRWDRDAAEVRNGTGALLAISDSGSPLQAMGLDVEHLRSGSFIYLRQSGRVDVRLTVHQQGGSYVAEVFTFLGRSPAVPSAQDATVHKQQADAVQEAERLKTELEKQAARTRKLEQTIEGLRRQVQDEPRKRADAQIPETARK